ncbi:hypothetical protein PsorP6_004826 [Peronosclerospora sorghi]|uniref:Uncharacterized protein n=1 Tax=Peronosclerospora sorghi TaxID=230839 RepID=A0ACC0VKT1_9STRA|nr:hypothetical protein PsorP6_004826 [Peronosclerospora sorghi]
MKNELSSLDPSLTNIPSKTYNLAFRYMLFLFLSLTRILIGFEPRMNHVEEVSFTTSFTFEYSFKNVLILISDACFFDSDP